MKVRPYRIGYWITSLNSACSLTATPPKKKSTITMKALATTYQVTKMMGKNAVDETVSKENKIAFN